MANQTKTSQKLLYLEYTDLVFLYLDIFVTVDFETKGLYWKPDFSYSLMEEIWPKVETWQPDVIFWRSRIVDTPHLAEEPDEWLAFCQRLHSHPTLRHTKIMALFSSPHTMSDNLKPEWQDRYDFFERGTLRAVTHAKVARQLVGQPVKGVEGVNEYLLKINGTWSIRPRTNYELTGQDRWQTDAEGKFESPPFTRLLTVDDVGQVNWVANGIEAKRPTHIIYVIKSKSVWQEGWLQTEIEQLRELAARIQPDYQLLMGVNDILLELEPTLVNRILKQVYETGGWRVFINEHMWFESSCSVDEERFERIVYQQDKSLYQQWDLIAM